jgi:hypothetical protein
VFFASVGERAAGTLGGESWQWWMNARTRTDPAARNTPFGAAVVRLSRATRGTSRPVAAVRNL